MPVFSIELPDKRVIDIEAGDQATALRGAKEWHAANPKPAQGWGEYFKGLGREAVQGATFDFGNELGLTDRAASEQFSAENPIASTVARIAGSLPTFALGPGAAAARWATAGSSLARTAGRSALLGAGAGAASGAGAGEGLEGRLEGAATGAAVGGGLGGILPPALAGAARAGRTIRDVVSPQMARAGGALDEWRTMPRGSSPPVEGATWIADGATPPGTAAPSVGAEAQADQMLANQAMRAGLTVDDLRARLAQGDVDRSFYPGASGGSRGADTQTLMDVDDAFARMAGSFARASPEARNEFERFMTARQTGVTPRRGALNPESGLTTREPGVPRTTLTSRGKFATAEPAGQYERVHEGFKRALAISDEDFHGHAVNPLRTDAQIETAMRADSKPVYGRAFAASDMMPERIPAAITPILQEWGRAAAEAAPGIGNPLNRALRQFYTTNDRTQVIANLRRFDSGKQALDKMIGDNLGNPIGRELIMLKQQLLAAVDGITEGNIGALYSEARGIYSGNARSRDILRRFRDSFWKDDSEVTADDFLQLETRGEQKLARLGLLWGYERMAGSERTRDITRVFNSPRIQEMLGRVMPSTGLEPGRATPGNIAQRFLRFVETERNQSQLRQRVTGGSPTAERLADDAAHEQMSEIIDSFRSSPGVLSAGIAYISRTLNRLFGYQADAAMAAAMRLTVADPAARERVLEGIARRMGRSRFEEFTRLMAEHQAQASTIGTQAIVPSAATPQRPQQPEFL
jgi:hypothetical protein